MSNKEVMKRCYESFISITAPFAYTKTSVDNTSLSPALFIILFYKDKACTQEGGRIITQSIQLVPVC